MKYIIDIPTELAEATAEYWNKTTDMTLVPYTEPDLSPLVDEAVETIENEVWEFVKKVRLEDFIDDNGKLRGYLSSFDTYQEAKAKYESWKKQKDEIHIGDEVKENSGLWTGVVVGFDEFDALIIMDSSGKSCGGYKTKFFRKTGRHFDEVEELLKKMRESE